MPKCVTGAFTMTKKSELLTQENIEKALLIVRGEKVLLDSHLAEFYGVEVRVLNQAVKRNLDRFPEDFAFQLTEEEFTALRSQFVTSKQEGRGGRRYAPYAFTEQGVAMLSSVLRSKQAVQVNVEIMRAFVRLRRVLAVSAELARRLDEVEKRLGDHDEQFVQVIRAIRQLMEPPATPPRRRIGFHATSDAIGKDRPAGSRAKSARGAAKKTVPVRKPARRGEQASS
jgi:hypothetical protein